jgi:hypothetical protein
MKWICLVLIFFIVAGFILASPFLIAMGWAYWSPLGPIVSWGFPGIICGLIVVSLWKRRVCRRV